MNLPNQLTLLRCCLAIVFVAFMSFENAVCFLAAFLVFVLAIITDWLDGRLARRWNMVSNFGKLLDPVADKVLMVAGFIMLLNMSWLTIPGWTIVAILAREFLVTGVRSLGATEGIVIPANIWGKVKTGIQMGYVVFFVFVLFLVESIKVQNGLGRMLPGSAEQWVRVSAFAARYCAVLVAFYTVYSGIQFGWANWKNLNLHKQL
jgi:CDP-diacylglycerol---glycerol-3-phosphate 3-phosphatidyltransferase